MFKWRNSILNSLSEEIVGLASAIVPATVIVTGQTKDFGEASGSAWLFDAQHLVTNHHVIDGLVLPVWVKFPGAKETRAQIVGSDPHTDLAVLRIVDPQHAQPIALREQPARLGELCFALGSPLGQFPESISLGIVSGLKRSLPSVGGRRIYDVIQTDCAINPGNSGGPLIGVDGRVIGVNTAIISGASGIGFAVPSDTVLDIVPELISYGGVQRASLGVSVAMREVRLEPVPKAAEDRLVVTAVRSAAAGPFQVGDVLLTLGVHEVRARQDLFRILRRNVMNQNLPVGVWREGARVNIDCVPSAMKRPKNAQEEVSWQSDR